MARILPLGCSVPLTSWYTKLLSLGVKLPRNLHQQSCFGCFQPPQFQSLPTFSEYQNLKSKIIMPFFSPQSLETKDLQLKRSYKVQYYIIRKEMRIWGSGSVVQHVFYMDKNMDQSLALSRENRKETGIAITDLFFPPRSLYPLLHANS